MKRSVLNRIPLIIFFLSFFHVSYAQENKKHPEKKAPVQKKEEKIGYSLSNRQLRIKRREDNKRLRDERKKARLEKKALKKHHKNLQSKETFKRMKESRKKANKKNRKNGF